MNAPPSPSNEPSPSGPSPVGGSRPLPPAAHDPYAALRTSSFRFYMAGNLLSILGLQMQTVAISWEVWQRTRDEWYLGLVGLTQIVPVLGLVLVVGLVADRFERKRIVQCCLGAMWCVSLGLTATAALGWPTWLLYALIFVNGVARAFVQPAKASLLPQIVSRDRFTNAVTWSASTFQLASVMGPALAGLLIWALSRGGAASHAPSGAAPEPADPNGGGGATWIVFLAAACCELAFFTFLGFVRLRPRAAAPRTEASLAHLTAGFRFVAGKPVLIGALTLDMVAVLLGGATALMPVYATDILHVDSRGFGLMEATPAVGALVMGVILAHRRPFERAGRTLLLAVAAFGAATIVFGLSRSFPLSLAMLFTLGAVDNISVVIRHTLVQTLTPDEMRGRVSAVNGMFIGASNELGAFESGLVAAVFGPVVSVVSGGLGTLAVVTAAAWFWPDLRRFGRLDGHGATTTLGPGDSNAGVERAARDGQPLAAGTVPDAAARPADAAQTAENPVDGNGSRPRGRLGLDRVRSSS